MTRITNKRALELGLIEKQELNDEEALPDAAAGVADTPALEERNREIYRRKVEGTTQAQLARAYGLSPEWIRRICEDQERKARAGETDRVRMGEGRDEEDTELYLLLVEKNAFLASSGKLSGTPIQAYHCVSRKWKKDGNDGHPDPEYLRQLTEEEIRAIPGAGRAIEAFLSNVKHQMSEADARP